VEDSNAAQFRAMSIQHSNIGAISFISINVTEILSECAALTDL
jgi:hypothetical protein